MNYPKNRTYFDNTVREIVITSGILFIIFGILMLLPSVLLPGGMFYLSLAASFLVLGILLLLTFAPAPMSDQDYDNIVESAIGSNIDNVALNKLGIDSSEVQEAKPIYIRGYEFKNASNIKKGKDGIWRSNLYKLIAIYFSQSEIHVYTKIINSLREQRNEATDVYFYNDIVSISTSSETEKILNFTIDYESFVLTTKGGTKLSVAIKNTSDIQRSVNAMRSLLRIKKNG